MRIVGLTLLVGFFAVTANAEDVENKFRIGVGVGFLNAQDEVPSDSANTLTLVDSLLSPVDFYRDPRNDSGAFGNLEITPGPLASVFGQFALSKTFLIEVSAGYQRTQIGNVQVQAQFDGLEVPDTQRFNFQIYEVEVGDVERIPVQLGFMARFRPRASLNPYLGAGLGYDFVGFEPSDEFNQLSVNMDAAQGTQYSVTSAYFGNETLVASAEPVQDLDGARVEVGGTWSTFLLGGVELSFKRKWVVFVDARYSFSSRSVSVGFDGGTDFGNSVPLLTDFCANPPGAPPAGGTRETVCPGSQAGQAAINGVYGPTRISLGGLIDGGTKRPIEGAPPDTNCADPLQSGRCEFVLEPDGVVDPGFYYVQGGSFKYDAFSVQVGVRYTF